MENMVKLKQFWKGKRVLVTGHTGFKGGWLVLLLKQLGAEIVGYSLAAATTPNLFEQANIASDCLAHVIGDIRDQEEVKEIVNKYQPEIVFHLAAQPLVRASYATPVETYATNVMGTLHVLEAVRQASTVRALVIVTSDKCYENKEWVWGYRENEPMGGHDPYSSSKACTELLTASYRASYYSSQEGPLTSIATARAGNVIGGGDWSDDRLIPDLVRAVLAKEEAVIRKPYAVRPWQHVLESLSGYINLAEKLYSSQSAQYSSAWNFGPEANDARSVEWIVSEFTNLWGNPARWRLGNAEKEELHEATYLKLDCSKAKSYLNWLPRWNIDQALAKTVAWYKAYAEGENIRDVCLNQIQTYLED